MIIMRYLNLKKSSGQLLVEVLITMAILSVGLLGLIKLQGLVIFHSKYVWQQHQAVSIATDKLEEMEQWSDNPPIGSVNTYDDIASGSEQKTYGNTVYTSTWTVTENSNLAYKTITVQVQWSDINGVSRQISLSTIVNSFNALGSGLVIKLPVAY